MIQTLLLFESVEDIYRRVFRELKPRTPLREVHVSFRPYVHLDSNIRFDHDKKVMKVRISDQLESAPASIQEALAWMLLCKIFRKETPEQYKRRYSLYTDRADVREKSLLLRRSRGRKQIVSAQGGTFDLGQMFDDLNRRFFDGLLVRPQLTWSPKRSRRTLGHWDPAHNAIVISKIFDHPKVPRFLVEYVMYHEMLHLKHPVEHRVGQRRLVHTKAFYEDERKFPRYKEAVALVKRID